jgi:4-fold beta flower protein
MKIYDGKIYHDGQKIAWIDGHHVRAEADGRKLGYFDSEYVYNEQAHKVAYIHENELRFENGQPSIQLEKINEEIEGTVPLIEKCAIHVLLED